MWERATRRLGLSAVAACALLGTAEAGTFTARFENDLFYKADREYTTGEGFGWTTDPAKDGWAYDLARDLPWYPNDASVRTNYALDQAIFTPRDISRANPVATDRPYAAWLHGTLSIDAQSETRLSQFGVSLGVVGPWALGEEAQNLVHRLRGFSKAQGWHFQLHNEPGLVISDQQSWRFALTEPGAWPGVDFIPHAGAVIGNVYDYADGGALVRMGWLTSDWAPARINPAVPGTNVVDDAFGGYVFAGFEARAVARNIFLDGNSFERSRGVSKYPVVGEAEIGAAVTLHRVRIAYTHVFLSREYRTQADNHQYGALSIAWRF